MNVGQGDVNVNQVVGNASNIRIGGNPSYAVEDFLAFYSQFGTPKGIDATPNMPRQVIQLYIDLAQRSIHQVRYGGAWQIAMAYFVAHFCTLWVRSCVSVDAGKDAIVAAGQTQGIITSESVDGVSYSMDINSIMQDLEGFGAWKTTEFGVQLATFAKLYGKGGMVVQ